MRMMRLQMLCLLTSLAFQLVLGQTTDEVTSENGLLQTTESATYVWVTSDDWFTSDEPVTKPRVEPVTTEGSGSSISPTTDDGIRLVSKTDKIVFYSVVATLSLPFLILLVALLIYCCYSYSCHCSITKRTSLPKNHAGKDGNNDDDYIPDILKYNNNLKHVSLSLTPLNTAKDDEEGSEYTDMSEHPDDKQEEHPREDTQKPPGEPSASSATGQPPRPESQQYATYLPQPFPSTQSLEKEDHSSLEDPKEDLDSVEGPEQVDHGNLEGVHFSFSKDHIEEYSTYLVADTGEVRHITSGSLERAAHSNPVAIRWNDEDPTSDFQGSSNTQLYATYLPISANSRPISEASSNEVQPSPQVSYRSDTPLVANQGAPSTHRHSGPDVRDEITRRLLNVVDGHAPSTSLENITLDIPDDHGNSHHGNKGPDGDKDVPLQHTYMTQDEMPRQLVHAMNTFAYDNVIHDIRDEDFGVQYVNLNRR